MVLVLGIETTCDETACAIVRDGKEIISNVIHSQTDLHCLTGGVIPEQACRRHIDLMIPVIDTALKEACVSLEEIDLIAAAKGPGLIGALLIGLSAAKALAFSLGKPFVGVNHLQAHLYAAWMSTHEKIPLPALGVILSGGHTSLVKIHSLLSFDLIGQTTDDAVGEAFDKVATLLGLPYPGGPGIEKLALGGNPRHFPLKAGLVKGRPFDFSFSGLKTNVLYTLKGQGAKKEDPSLLSAVDLQDLAASFQETALHDVVQKARLAASHFGCKSLLLGGGVTQNQRLKELLYSSIELPIFLPAKGLSQDNAAMIAGLAFHHGGRSDSFALEPMTRIPFYRE